ncbi:alanine racemase [Haloferula rosea]|uniref:Alanine racemase n=1 Tax=Haloferula rosea TaxID=490093 RepID=A0A934RF13_9BACT|nr:alanine racemase [Haloferula rosea]
MGAPSPPRAWAEIDLSALRHNLEVAREISSCAVMAVVKAGAYGHELETVARTLAQADVAFFGVANVGEARRIADAGVTTRIYLLGATWADERAEIVARGWTPCLSSLDEARDFDQLAQAANVRLKVHLAVDTGMGRGGFVADDLPHQMPQLEALDGIEIEGLGSHLPSADEDETFTREQFTRFTNLAQALGGRDRFKWIHLSNSAGLLGYPSSPCNLVRPGLMLYGISPLPKFQDKLKNVMSLKSRVTLIRELPAGHGVSYGRTFITQRPTRVATIGIGYGDGYPRHLSGQGAEVWIKGHRHPLLGRVTMDQIMIDVTDHADIEVGDEVEVFGPHLRVDEVAAKAGTIAWEILTGITPRVVRVHHTE